MDTAFPGLATYRGVSVVVGAFYILSFISGILSIAKAADDTEYLTKSALHAKQIYKAAFFQLLMAVFYLGIAIVLYPLLKMHHQTLAIGFLSFRILAVQMVILGAFILLMILKLSQVHATSPDPAPSCFKVMGDLLKTGRDVVNHVAMVIMLCIGGILLNIIMIQSELIPLWLSVWGIVGALVAILASILVLLRYIEIIRPTYIILNIPIAVQEIVFAIWLIVIGFQQG